MTKGFITVATGNKYYYQLAYNLLQSYRFYSSTPCPFAIIAEEKNEFTSAFDIVIITQKAQRSFMDKLLVFENLPFDETIFIDSDSLCYGDLNKYWEIFQNSTDFSSFGENFSVDKNETGDVWYNLDGIGKYGKGVSYRCRVHAGVLYFRKSEALNKLYNDCLDIVNNYEDYNFTSFSKSVDECSLAVAAAYNNMTMTASPLNSFVAYFCCSKINVNMFSKEISYTTPWSNFKGNCILIHFGTPSTKTPTYRFSIECLNYLSQQKKPKLIQKLLYEKKWRFFFMNISYKVKTFMNRILIKLKLKK